jgi:hypothetical protein
MNTVSIARFLMLAGVGLFLIGGIVYLLARLGVNLFNLPGDIRLQTENLTCLVPITSMILLSILLSVILSLAIRFLNK